MYQYDYSITVELRVRKASWEDKDLFVKNCLSIVNKCVQDKIQFCEKAMVFDYLHNPERSAALKMKA